MIGSVRVALARASHWLSPGVRFEPKDDTRRCGGCGYPFPGGVRGSPAPCSECGRFIDPGLPAAFAREQPAWIVRALLLAPGLPFLAAALVVGGLILHAISVPGGRFDSLLIGVLLAMILGAVFAARAAVALVLGLAQRCSARVWRQPGWRVLGALVVLFVLVAWAGVPRRIAFLADRSQLASLAEKWAADPSACRGAPDAELEVPMVDGRPMAPLDFGQFAWRVRDTGPEVWRGFVVYIRSAGFMDTRGAYLYLPALPEEVAEDCGLLPHGGGWYSGELTL